MTLKKAAAPLALMLMLLTGLVAGQLSRLSPVGSTSVPGRSSEVVATANEYFDALNRLFTNGDSSAIRAILHPQFTDHSSHDGIVRSSQEFETLLTEIARTSPGLHLQASMNIAQGNVVGAEVTYGGPAEITTGAIALQFDTRVTKFEVLKIEGGKVIERWSESAILPPGHIEVPASLRLQMPDRSLDTALHRMTLGPSTRLHFPNETGAIVMVESGSLELVTKPVVNQTADQAWPATSLNSGDARAVQSGASFLMSNTGNQRVTVLVATFDDLDYKVSRFLDSAESSVEPDATHDVLTFSSGGASAGTCEVALLLIDLSPGTSVASHTVQASEIALVIEGDVELEMRQGGRVRQATDPNPQRGPLELVTDDAIAATSDVVLSYHDGDDSPARLLLITVTPAEAERSWP